MSLIFRPKYIIFVCWLLVILQQGTSTTLSSKRIISEWKDINKAGLDLSIPFDTSNKDECGIRLSPLRNNLLEWHFSFIGMDGSAFENGIYHGKIKLHPEYPRKAPIISISTPSGRWETNTPICLSASSHHQELWNPNWNLRTLVLSLRNFMTSQPGEIGSIHATPEVHRHFALMSNTFVCQECGLRHSDIIKKNGEIKNAQSLFLKKADEEVMLNSSMRMKKPTARLLKQENRSKDMEYSIQKRTKKKNIFTAIFHPVKRQAAAFIALLLCYFFLQNYLSF